MEETWQYLSIPMGQDTVFAFVNAVSNSLHTTGTYQVIRDLYINGANADQIQLGSSYITLERVLSGDHGTYNLNITGGNNILVSNCWFGGKPVKSVRPGVTFANQCYFNGQGTNGCLILSGSAVTVRDSCLESYATDPAITVADPTTSYAIDILNNYFETSYTVTNTIVLGAGFISGRLEGNYEATSGTITNSITLAYGRDVVIIGNQFYQYYDISTAVTGLMARHKGGINYNGLTGLSSLDILYVSTSVGIPTLYGTSAPASGDWPKGSAVLDPTPSSGATEGWRCTTGGTSSVWKAKPSLA